MRKQIAMLFCAAFFAFAAHGGAALARDGMYRSVVVDTSRLARKGDTQLAAALKPLLAGELSKALGPRLGRHGGQLVVRIVSIRIPPTAGDTYSDQANPDRLEAVVTVPGRGSFPILIQLPSSGAGAWYAENYNERRVYRLIEALAQWTARKV